MKVPMSWLREYVDVKPDVKEYAKRMVMAGTGVEGISNTGSEFEGVVVGRVSEISFDATLYEATVSMSLDSRYHFPKDTSAAIMTSGLLGEQYVALEAGGEDKMLADGDSLKLTQGAVVLENLIGQFLYSKSEGEGSAPAAGKLE